MRQSLQAGYVIEYVNVNLVREMQALQQRCTTDELSAA